MNNFSEPLEYVAANSDDLVSLAMEYLAVDTQNPPGETVELVDLIEQQFTEAGLAVERFAVDPAKPNVIATLPGDDDLTPDRMGDRSGDRPGDRSGERAGDRSGDLSGERAGDRADYRTLLYNGHVDTVPFDAGAWSFDPLGEQVEHENASPNADSQPTAETRLYGRGATDMKGPLASMMLAARAYAETDTRPPITLAFAIVSDEETGGSAGLKALLANERIDADACVIGETTCSGGNHSVTIADRGSIWLTLQATGQSAHSSRPMQGVNAIDRLWAAIDHLRSSLGTRELEIGTDIQPIVDESVDYYAPTIGADATRELFSHPTVNLGRIEGGEAVNSVPRTARAKLDIRLTAGVETPTILADIRDCIGDHDRVTIADTSWSVGTAEAIDSPFVDTVATVATDVTGDRIFRRSATGGGDAKKLRNAGIPTVEFALGTETAHGVDEYTLLEALQKNAEIYTRLPMALARSVSND